MRTYLQGVLPPLVPADPSYTPPVASVTSFGSPYNGLFPSDGDGFFMGYDPDISSVIRDGCRQVSCYQMGQDLGERYRSAFNTTLGTIPNKIKLQPDRPIPNQIKPLGLPYQSLIGLRIDRFSTPNKLSQGDGLISYGGQRFFAGNSGGDESPLHCGQKEGGSITERLLGVGQPPSGGIPSAPVPEGFSGYKHTSSSVDLLRKADNTEVEVKPPVRTSDFRVASIRNWISGKRACDAPRLITKSTSGTTVTPGQPYSITVEAAHADGNPVNISFSWE